MIRQILLFIFVAFGVLPISAKEKVSQATLDSLFEVGVGIAEHGRFDKSNAYLEALTKVYKMPLVFKYKIYSRIAVNYNLAGDYQMMYKYLSKFRSKEELVHLYPLTLLPREQIERSYYDVTIPFTVDSLYNEKNFGGCEISIPVEIDGKEEMFVMDNGMTKYSTVTESFAQEHGIRPIGYNGQTFGTINESSMWLGIADSIKVGRLVIRNLIFCVVPDDNITSSVLNYNAYLGANFFRLVGEMVFDNRRRTVTFPFIQRPHQSNMTINALGEHFAEVELDGNNLLFHFDLGYTQTSLTSNYYNRFKTDIEKSCRAGAAVVGGVGGTNTILVYYKKHPTIYFNGVAFMPPTVLINTVRDHNEGSEYGKLGNDFLLSYRRVILNLQQMYMMVE